MSLKTHGVTENTPKNLILGAGSFYKNLKYSSENKKWEGTIFGATKGGGKVTISQEYTDVEPDGASVAVKGLKYKSGETATLESTLIELTKDFLVTSLHLKEDTTKAVDGYKCYVSKRLLEDGDYLENIAYVGTLSDGRQAIIILPNAIVTSAFELEGKNKEVGTFAMTAECTASFEQDDLEHLPYEIYYPEAAQI